MFVNYELWSYGDVGFRFHFPFSFIFWEQIDSRVLLALRRCQRCFGDGD